MKKEDFFKLIENYGFNVVKKITQYGEIIFETPIESDGWMDGYNVKYILTFHSTFGLRFDIDRFSEGGFCGNSKIEERLFSGHIKEEADFIKLLEMIGFSAKK